MPKKIFHLNALKIFLMNGNSEYIYRFQWTKISDELYSKATSAYLSGHTKNSNCTPDVKMVKKLNITWSSLFGSFGRSSLCPTSAFFKSLIHFVFAWSNVNILKIWSKFTCVFENQILLLKRNDLCKRWSKVIFST